MLSSFALPLTMVLTSALTVVGVLLMTGALPSRRAPDGPARNVSAERASFFFRDGDLVDLNATGSQLMDSLLLAHPMGTPWSLISRFLARDFPALVPDLLAAGQPLSQVIESSVTPGMELRIDRLDGGVRLSILDSRDDPENITVDRLSFRAMNDEIAILQATCEQAPILIWREEGDGLVTWANGPYIRAASQVSVADAMSWPLPALFPPMADGKTRRASLRLADDTQGWFDIHAMPDSDTTLVYALPADQAHQAETLRRDFIQTLSKTFATLPTGLAVFDRSRRLQMFNPALVDLTRLEPEFLVSKPGLEGFLNRMREKRVLPEPRDFHIWSRRLLEIESSQKHREFEETWSLPSGQTYRVTTSPHPDGALAFMIEDITPETHLTRGFRQQMECSQAVLDTVDSAIAVFSSGGQLVLTNAAFSEMWTLEGEESLAAVTLAEAIENWREVDEDHALWERIAAIPRSTASDNIESGIMRLSSGEVLCVEATRLRTGSMMIRFFARSNRDGEKKSGRAHPLRATA
ncbi:MAG: PAS-domain containing protein [Paracoccaceae bacterium]